MEKLVFAYNRYILFVLILFFATNVLSAQKAELLKEISAIKGSDPTNFTLFKDKVYFSALEILNATDYLHSLWVTDGTTKGTIKIKTCSPTLTTNLADKPFVTSTSLIFFQGFDSVNGRELWTSDGTPEGTKMVKNITPNGNTKFGEFIVFKNKLFFSANDGVDDASKDALWVSDGTEKGTFKIKDFPHKNFAYVEPNKFTIFEDKMFLYFGDDGQAHETWVTDGTSVGWYEVNSQQLWF